MIDASQILADVPESAGSSVEAAQALGQSMHEGHLGDPQLNGEHVVGQLGIRDLVSGKLGENILRAANKASTPEEAGLAGLAHVEGVVNKHSDSLDSGLKEVFSDSDRKPVEEEAADHEDHKELAGQINNLANNPSGLIQQLSESTLALHAVAPQIASSAQQTATRAIQFLATKLPKSEPNPLGTSEEPSLTQIASFNRYLGIVESPTRALTQIKNGTLTPETTETLQTVYPRLFDKMKQGIIAGLDPQLPYQKKMVLSQFLGEPLDSSLTTQRVLSFQKSFLSAPSPQAPQAEKAPKKSLSKLDVASRTSLAPKDEP